MRQKTKNNRNQGSNPKKIFFFGFVPKSPTRMGSLSAKNASKKFSRLGTFKDWSLTDQEKTKKRNNHFYNYVLASTCT